MNLSAEDATDFLTSWLGGPVTDAEPLHGGDWSQAFGLDFENSPLVARFGHRHVDDFEKDRAAFRFSSAELPIPEVLGICPAFAGYCCISRRKFGAVLETSAAVPNGSDRP